MLNPYTIALSIYMPVTTVLLVLIWRKLNSIPTKPNTISQIALDTDKVLEHLKAHNNGLNSIHQRLESLNTTIQNAPKTITPPKPSHIVRTKAHLDIINVAVKAAQGHQLQTTHTRAHYRNILHTILLAFKQQGLEVYADLEKDILGAINAIK